MKKVTTKKVVEKGFASHIKSEIFGKLGLIKFLFLVLILEGTTLT